MSPLIIGLLILFVGYLGGLFAGYKLGDRKHISAITLALTLVAVGVMFAGMFVPAIGQGLVGRAALIAFPLCLGTFRGSRIYKMRNPQGKGGPGSGA